MKAIYIILLSLLAVVLSSYISNQLRFSRTLFTNDNLQIVIGFHPQNALFDIHFDKFDKSIQILRFSLIFYNLKNMPF